MNKIIQFFNRYDSEDPKITVIRNIVHVFHLALIVTSVRCFVFHFPSIGNFFDGVLIYITLILFFGFLLENEVIMSWGVTSMYIFIPIYVSFYLFSTLASLFAPPIDLLVEKAVSFSNETLIPSNLTEPTIQKGRPICEVKVNTMFHVLAALKIGALLVYTWLCEQLLDALSRKASNLSVVNKAAHKVADEAENLLQH